MKSLNRGVALEKRALDQFVRTLGNLKRRREPWANRYHDHSYLDAMKNADPDCGWCSNIRHWQEKVDHQLLVLRNARVLEARLLVAVRDGLRGRRLDAYARELGMLRSSARSIARAELEHRQTDASRERLKSFEELQP